MTSRSSIAVCLVSVCCGLPGSLFGQQEPKSPGDRPTTAVKLVPARPASVESSFTITPEREAAAMTFARRHHRELAALLEQLKQMNPSRYESAISDLFRASERLARLQERQPERYESELAIWKIDSRVRLLAARSVAGTDDTNTAQMKKLLLERNNIRVRQLEADRERLQGRLERLDETIGQLREGGKEQAERDLERLLRTVRGRVVPQNSPMRRDDRQDSSPAEAQPDKSTPKRPTDSK